MPTSRSSPARCATCRAAPARARSSSAIPVQMGTAGTADTPFARPPAAGRQPGRREERHGARARGVRQRRRQPDAGPVRASCAWARSRTAPALLVNERAVGTDQNKKFVMVVGDDNKAAYREVTLGAHVNGLRIVTSGLKPQERVVVNGLQRVRPGALVAPQPVDDGTQGRGARATPRRAPEAREARHEPLQILHRPADLRRRALAADLPRRPDRGARAADLRVPRRRAAVDRRARATTPARTRR